MNHKINTIISSLLCCTAVLAATAVDPANPYAYGANSGWVNAYADGANGAVIGQAFCSGYMYGANVGWIHLGDGAPANGMAYQDTSAADFIVRNSASDNGTNYVIGAGNDVGTIQTTPVGAGAWDNFSF